MVDVDINVLENDDDISIVFKNKNPPKDVILDTTSQPDYDKIISMSISKNGQINLKDIKFSKDVYDKETVQATADRIQNRFQQEGCKPCIALSEANKTQKVFVLPFLTLLKDLVDVD
jgi:uncharacterized membrane protein YcaP (DUF421 family)